MPPVLDHAHAGHFDIADQRAIAAEDPAVDDIAFGRAGQDRRVGIQHDDVALIEAGAVGSTRDCTIQQGAADARHAHARRDVASLRAQALPVFQPAQFLDRIDRAVRIRTHAPAPARIQVIPQREQAIAKIRFGGGTDRHGGTAARDVLHFAIVQVGGVHQRPARVHRHAGQQPFHRPRTAQGDAFLDLWQLFGNVDVDPRRRRQRGQHLVHRVGRHRAQAVQRAADAHCVAFAGPQGLEQSQIGVDGMAEALLARRQRPAIEATGHVQHRQQGDADAGIARGEQQRLRHCIGLRIGRAIRPVVQVVEFADRGVTGFEHLHVQLRGNGVQQVGIEARGHRVHGFAPGPERIRGIGLAFGQAGHRPLEGMRMQVGDAGQGPAARGAGGDRRVRRVHRRIVAQTRRGLR